MQFGVCGGVEVGEAADRAGYSYIECPVGTFLKPREDEPAFIDSLNRLRTTGTSAPALNCFLPADLKVTGPDADPTAQEKYATTAFRRAEKACVKVIVFGSGGARHIPDGFDRKTAHDQIVRFCRMCARSAGEHGVTLAVEPLSRADCNVIHTVAEAVAIVREVDHPAVQFLVDAYHFFRNGDSLEDIVANAPLLAHVHVATLKHRLAPGTEECSELKSFFATLKKAGYKGRVSIEAGLKDPATELPRAFALMTTLSKA
jgi:sugar phosphate isomerase/epimerase